MKKFLFIFFISVCSSLIVKAQSSSCPDDLIPKRFMSNGKMGFVDLFDNWKIKPKYFEVSPFENRFAKVRYGNSYGMINCEGKEVVPPEFEELGFFSYGRIWAKNESGWFLWDSSGSKLTESPFDNYKRASIWHSYAWVSKNGKWKILNEKDGQLICEKEFTSIKLLSDTLSLVSNDSYFGILNHKTCQFKIPETIVNAQKVSSEFIKLRFRNRKYDIINLEGESILQKPYDQIQSAGNGLAKVKSNNKWGLITPKGKVILTIEYDSIRSFHYGRLALQKSGKWFYINEKLFPINDSLFDIASDFTTKGALVKKEGKWALIDLKGKELFSGLDSIVYHDALLFSMLDSKWQLLSNEKDKDTFDLINFSDKADKCRVKKDGKWGIYNFVDSKWLIAVSYSEMEFISNEKLLVQKDNKKGLVDINGNSILPITYSMMEWQAGFRNNLFLVKDERFRLIDEKNKSILESNYPIRRQKSLFILEDEKKKYLYEHDGDLIFEDKIDSILVLDDSYFAIKDKGNWGLMDVKGKEILDTDHSSIKLLSDNFIALMSDDFWEIFRTDGKKITGAELQIREIQETFKNSFIVESKKNLIWIDVSSKILEKGFEDYKLLRTGQVALKRNSKWIINNMEGKSVSDMQFDNLVFDNNLELLQSKSVFFQIDTKDKLSIYLPFD